MKFKDLEKGEVSNVNKSQIDSWKKNKIFEKSIENRKDSKNFVFYDGPATANGNPGLHHMVAKLLKDAICKYKTMQ